MKTKNNMSEFAFLELHLFTWIGAILILFGTLMIHGGNQIKNKVKMNSLQEKLKDSRDNINRIKQETDAQTIKLTALKEMNYNQSIDLEKQTNQIENISKDNIELSRELAKASIEIKYNMLGGNSYPKIYYIPNQQTPFVLDVYLEVIGNNPLYDVTFNHINSTEASKISRNWKDNKGITSQEEYNKYMKAMQSAPKLRGGNFNPIGGVVKIGEGLIEGLINYTGKEYKLGVRTYARNGTFRQNTVLKRDKYNRWVIASFEIVRENKVDDSKNKVLEEKKD